MPALLLLDASFIALAEFRVHGFELRTAKAMFMALEQRVPVEMVDESRTKFRTTCTTSTTTRSRSTSTSCSAPSL